MNINATLFVQMVHFLIAYVLLRRFLFKPVASVIFAQRAYYTKLKDVIEHEEHAIIRKQEQQKEQWNIFQQEWQEAVPSLERRDTKKFPELIIQKVPLSKDVLSKEVQKVVQDIKESIDNV